MPQTTKINQIIIDIIKDNQKVDAIKKLIKIIPQHPVKTQKILQQTILYLMQAQHDWTNVIKFIFLWDMQSWGKQFQTRMKQRVQQEQRSYQNLQKQLLRLAERFWLLISPKKQPQSYDEFLKPKNQQKKDISVFSKRFSFSMLPPKVQTNTHYSKNLNIDIENKQLEKKKSVQQEKKLVQENLNNVNKEQKLVPILTSQVQKQRPKTPPKIKFNQNKIKIVENSAFQSNKCDFSFSNIKPKQDRVQKEITAQKQKYQLNEVNDFQSAESKVRRPADPYDLSFQQFQAQKKRQKSIVKAMTTFSARKQMFSQQQMALIDFSKPRVNKLQKYLLKNGINVKNMLRTALNQL